MFMKKSFINILLIVCISVVFISGAPVFAAKWYEYYQEAKDAAEKKDWTTAIDLFKKAIAEEPESGKQKRTYGISFIEYYPYLELGKAYLAIGELTFAQNYCEKEKQKGGAPRDEINKCLTMVVAQKPPTPTPQPMPTSRLMPTPLPTAMPLPQKPTPFPTAMPRPSTPTPHLTVTPTPSYIDQQLELADRYFNKKWYFTPKETNAFDAYKEVLKSEPANRHAREKLYEIMEVYKNIGDANYKEIKYDKARTCYEQYIEIADYLSNILGDQTRQLETVELQKRLKVLKASVVVLTDFSQTPTPQPLTPTPEPDNHPSLTLTSVIPEKTENDTLAIQGIATDDHGVTDVKVTVKKPGSKGFLPTEGLQRDQEKFSANVLLAVGKNDITIEASDTAGQTAKEVFTVARIVPPTPTPEPDTPPALTLTSVIPEQTETDTLVISGITTDDHGIPNVKVTVKKPGSKGFLPTAGLQRDQEKFSANIPLAVGKNEITIEASDTAGQTAKEVFTVARIVPPTPTPEPDERPALKLASAIPSETEQEALAIQGNATDDRGISEITVTVKKPGAKKVTTATLQRDQDKFSTDIPLDVGNNEITVEAIDTKGQTVTETFTVVRTVPPTPTPEPDERPALKLVSALPSETEQEALAIQGNATDDRGISEITVTVKKPGAKKVTPATLQRDQDNFSADISLEVGDNEITVRAVDTKGQTVTETFTVVRTVLPPPTPEPDMFPFVTVKSEIPAETERELLEIQGLATDDKGVTDVTVSVKKPGTTTFLPVGNLLRDQDNFKADVQLGVGQNTIMIAAKDTTGQVGRRVFTIVRIVPPPPTPEPDNPPVLKLASAIPSETEQEALAIAGTATDDHGIQDIKITVKKPGTDEIATAPLQRAQDKFSAEIPLAVGKNEITVEAINTKGQAVTEVFTVARTVPAGPPKQKGDVYAVIIAIANYQDSRLNLKYTVNDAQGLYDVLTAPEYGGVPKDHIQLLLDKDATTRNIKNKLGTWLPRQAKEEDTVIIYYSGHGAPEREKTYWVTYDADVNDLYSSALSNNDIHEMLTAIKSERMITFLDSCYSAATVVRTDQTRSIPTEIPLEKFLGKGRLVISASDGKQFSLELPEYGHGVFTYYLLKGLQGEADGKAGGPPDGVIDADEIWNYVKYQVMEAAAKKGNPQTPVFQGSTTAGIPLTRNMAFFQEKQRLQTFEENKKKLTELFRKGIIQLEHFNCAVTMLNAPQLDPLLEGLLSGKISPDVFNQTFSCNPQ